MALVGPRRLYILTNTRPHRLLGQLQLDPRQSDRAAINWGHPGSDRVVTTFEAAQHYFSKQASQYQPEEGDHMQARNTQESRRAKELAVPSDHKHQ